MRGAGTIIKKCKCKHQTTCAHGWTLRWWDKGQHEETFSTKQLAQDRQAQVYRDKRAGEVTFAPKTKVEFVTYLNEWISSRKGNTRSSYQLALSKIRSQLQGKSLPQVAEDREGAQKLLDSLPASYRRVVRTIMVGACNEAVRAGKLPSHRLLGLKVEEDAGRAEFEYADRDQLEAFAKELGRLGLLVWTGRLAGLRIGESLGLNIADFRENGTVLRLSRQRLRDGKMGPLKARKDGQFRDIPVPAALWARVKDAPRDEQGFLFPDIWSAYVYKRVRAARDTAGLPGKFSVHWLRHMYASDLLGAGIPITDVATYMGHQDVKITFQTYGHLVPAAFGRARALLDAAWTA